MPSHRALKVINVLSPNAVKSLNLKQDLVAQDQNNNDDKASGSNLCSISEKPLPPRNQNALTKTSIRRRLPFASPGKKREKENSLGFTKGHNHHFNTEVQTKATSSLVSAANPEIRGVSRVLKELSSNSMTPKEVSGALHSKNGLVGTRTNRPAEPSRIPVKVKSLSPGRFMYASSPVEKDTTFLSPGLSPITAENSKMAFLLKSQCSADIELSEINGKLSESGRPNAVKEPQRSALAKAPLLQAKLGRALPGSSKTPPLKTRQSSILTTAPGDKEGDGFHDSCSAQYQDNEVGFPSGGEGPMEDLSGQLPTTQDKPQDSEQEKLSPTTPLSGMSSVINEPQRNTKGRLSVNENCARTRVILPESRKTFPLRTRQSSRLNDPHKDSGAGPSSGARTVVPGSSKQDPKTNKNCEDLENEKSSLDSPQSRHSVRSDRTASSSSLLQDSLESPSESDFPLRQRYHIANPNLPKWIDGDIPEHIFDNRPGLTIPEEVKSPVDYFRLFFYAKIMEYIVQETNLYSTQKDGDSMKVTVKELEAFFSIMIYMGIATLPSISDYWATRTKISQVADILGYRRFQLIRSRIHFVNNAEEPGEDRFRKIRPLLEKIRKKCQSLEQEGDYSIDECMVAYKGTMAGNLRQYMPDKPSSKWGFKLFVRAGVSGMTYDFIPYAGASTFDQENLSQEERDLGVGASAVIALCKAIPHPKSAVVTFDNFYSSIPLVLYLKKKMRILSLGTIRRDRIDKCPFSSDQDMKKKGRGSCESKVNRDNVVLIKWFDNKAVTLVSTFVGVEPKEVVQRYDKTAKSKIPIPCPKAIRTYNSAMGGVDLSDMFMALYKIPCKARRWYFPLLGYILDMCLTNSWLLYKRDCELLKSEQEIKPSKHFRLEVSAALATKAQQKKGRPSLDSTLNKVKVSRPILARPVDDLRRDGFEHWPGIVEKGPCRYCQMICRISCSKCECRLCLTSERNCFTQFHLQKNVNKP